MEELKPLDQVLQADERNVWRRITLEYLHEVAAEIQLSSSVPQPVRNQFAIASNAYIYSWFFSPFQSAALMYSFLAIELGLRLRAKEAAPTFFTGDRNPTLYPLLVHALQQRWITDGGFAGIPPGTQVAERIAQRFPKIPEDQRYSYNLLDVLVTLRNDLAHGAYMLAPGMGPLLGRGAEIINQLFPAQNT
jgi:hypothetical protein